MRNLPQFNFPAFFVAEDFLVKRGWTVFNPARRDIEKYGKGVVSPTGSIEEAKNTGFSLREALAADTKEICENSDAICLLPGWENSKGAKAEKALAEALGLDIYHVEMRNGVAYNIWKAL
jgi:hypothetical protein